MGNFNESEHPRDADGKFTDKSTPAEKKRLKEMGIPLKENGQNINLTKEEICLNEISGEKLTQEKKNDKIDKVNEIFKAKSIEEAEKYANEKLGLKANYKGIAVEVANEMNAAFKRGIDQCPAIKDKLKMVGSGQARQKELKTPLTDYYFTELKKLNPYHKDYILLTEAEKQTRKTLRIESATLAFASAKRETKSIEFNNIMNQYQGVYVNNRYGKNPEYFQNRLKQSVQNGYHPIGCDTIASVFDHEIAHILDYEFRLRENQEIQQLFNDNQSVIASELSRYAGEKDKYGKMQIMEFIAEGWAEYCNNPTPRRLAKEIGEIIKREIKNNGSHSNTKK